MAKRFTYEDAVRAWAMLDELGVTGGEARQEAEQEIIDKLGDKNFPESIGGVGLWDLERARMKDRDIEAAEEKKAKQMAAKKKAQADINALHQLSNMVTNPEQAAVNMGSMYGFEPPVSEEQFNAIRKMYGE